MKLSHPGGDLDSFRYGYYCVRMLSGNYYCWWEQNFNPKPKPRSNYGNGCFLNVGAAPNVLNVLLQNSPFFPRLI